MSSDDVHIESTGQRATITLDRPEKLNALTVEMFEAVGEAVTEFADQGEVDVVTLRGAGEHFSAGVDMSNVPEWIEQKPLEIREQLETVHETLDVLESVDLPIVAALEGHVLGGALELAISCDIRVATSDASFGLPESHLGLAMNYGGAQKLPGIIGEGMTKYLIMTGETIDADRAHEVGLVEEVADGDDFDERVAALEESLADKPTYVHGFTKQQVHSARPLNLEGSMQTAIHHAIAAYREEETQERSLEFIE